MVGTASSRAREDCCYWVVVGGPGTVLGPPLLDLLYHYDLLFGRPL